MDTCKRCGTVVPDEAVCHVCNANKGQKPLIVDFTATQKFIPLPVKQPKTTVTATAAKPVKKGGKTNATQKGKK